MGLAVCLEPLLEYLYEVLMEQLAENPDVFRIPGDGTGAACFGERRLCTLRELKNAGQAAGG
ncbi:hypothetical protein [Streptomyces sp. NPDC086766]|uniref:hypothetical protein n=1 Tax=Streptomyces sp. NPDC086766 TaxID=3365754 RepID=UPI0037F38E70